MAAKGAKGTKNLDPVVGCVSPKGFLLRFLCLFAAIISRAFIRQKSDNRMAAAGVAF